MLKKIETKFGIKEIEFEDWNGIEIPKTIYKYRDWKNEYHRKIILQQELFIPSPSTFNDPFDSNIPLAFELLKEDKVLAEKYFTKIVAREYPNLSKVEIIKKVKSLLKENRFNDIEYLENHKKYSIEELHKIQGTFCATAINDNILMWAHYANNHYGFCVGFDAKKLYPHFGSGGLVKYKKDYPKISPLKEDDIERMFEQSFTKANFWDYEIEYRLTKPGFVNQILKLDKEIITEIIIGYKMNKSDRDDLIKIIELELTNVKIFEIKPKLNSFELEIVEM